MKKRGSKEKQETVAHSSSENQALTSRKGKKPSGKREKRNWPTIRGKKRGPRKKDLIQLGK